MQAIFPIPPQITDISGSAGIGQAQQGLFQYCMQKTTFPPIYLEAATEMFKIIPDFGSTNHMSTWTYNINRYIFIGK